MRVGVDAFFEFVEAHPFAWRLIFRDPPANPAIAAVHTRIHERATQGIAVFLDVSAPGALREELVQRVLDFCWRDLGRLAET
jgi:hypothetical protein